MERLFSKYGTISSLHRGTKKLFSRGKEEGQEGWVWDGRWHIFIKVPDNIVVPSNMITEDDHWQVHYRGSVQACWKCLSTDHMSFRCRAKPRPKSNINWVPGGSHVDIVFPITEAEMDDPDFDYEAVSSQRSQMEEQWRRDGVPNAPSRDTQEDWKERSKQQENTLREVTRRANIRIGHLEKTIADLNEKLAKVESSTKRGRTSSLEEDGNQNKSPRVGDGLEEGDVGGGDGGRGTPGVGPEGKGEAGKDPPPAEEVTSGSEKESESEEEEVEEDAEKKEDGKKEDDEKKDEDHKENNMEDDEEDDGEADDEDEEANDGEDLLKITQEVPKTGEDAGVPQAGPVVPNPVINPFASQDTQASQGGGQTPPGQEQVPSGPSQGSQSQVQATPGQSQVPSSQASSLDGSQDMFKEGPQRPPGLTTFTKEAKERKEHKRRGSKKAKPLSQ